MEWSTYSIVPKPSVSQLRIGQLTRKKEFEQYYEDDDSLELEEKLEIDPKGPWYLRGAQVKEIDVVYFSDKDVSTASEGDALGETDDDFSVDDYDGEFSSSSSEGEEDETQNEGKEKEDEDKGEEVEEKTSSETKGDNVTQYAEDGSDKSTSSKSDSKSNPSDTSSTIVATDSNRMILNKKLAVSSDEVREAELNYSKTHGLSIKSEEELPYDMHKVREIREEILGRKVAMYQKDKSDYLIGKNKEEAMNETRGANYWKIRKTLKLLQVGDQYASQTALSLLVDCELENKENHAAIEDTGSLELFVNLLNVDWILCRVGALTVLDQITEANERMVEMSMDMGMVEDMERVLLSNDDQEVLMGVRCLCNVAPNKRSRTVIRKAGFIPILFYMIHRVPMELLRTKLSYVSDMHMHRKYEIALGSLYILTTIMRSKQVRLELFECGFISVIIPLLASREHLVVKAILEGVFLCASLRLYRERFEISGLMKLVLKHWKKHEEIVLRFVYKMSIGAIARNQIIETQVLSKVANFVMHMDNMKKDPYGYKYALLCLHRMGAHHDAREFFQKLGLLEPLIRILKKHPPDAFKLSICSVLATLSVYAENWKPIVESGGLQCILDIIFTHLADMWLLAHCLKILGDVAHSEDAREVLLQHTETLSFLLSLLKDGRPMITRCAASAIIPLTLVYIDFAEIIKGEADCLEFLLLQLEPSSVGSDDIHIKSTVCEALAAIMCDPSILQILSSLGLLRKISKVIKTENEMLQESVCLLISMCSVTEEERAELGRLGIIERLATFLTSSNIHVVIAAAEALWRLSFDTSNATRILTANTYKQLLQWSMSEFEELSDAALGVLANIRFAATTVEAENKSGPHWNIVAPEWSFPYHFKPHVFFHDEIELTPT